MTTPSNLHSLTWNEIEAQLKTLLPHLFTELESTFKNQHVSFQRVRYQFGSEILQEDLWQHRSPLCLITTGVVEADINLPSHLVPLSLLKPGTFLNLKTLFPKIPNSHQVDRACTYTAGSRSLLILPKISHEQYNERLSRAFTIPAEVLCPKTFFDQWHLFQSLANAPEFKSDWHTEVIVFSDEAVALMQANPALMSALFQEERAQNDFFSNQLVYDLVWSIFSDNLSNSVKNAPFIVETVKHLIKLAMAVTPGYAPASTSEQAPIQELMDVFLNIYRIRYYLPIFMELNYYNQQDPIYYSLQKHTFLCHIPQKTNANRTIDELISIKNLIQSFSEQVLENKFPIPLEHSLLYKTLQEVEFDFFHPQGGEGLHTDIESIAEEDPRFKELTENITSDKSVVFPKHSLFFNGCIRIRPLRKEAKVSMKNFLSSTGPFRLDEEK